MCCMGGGGYGVVYYRVVWSDVERGNDRAWCVGSVAAELWCKD